MNEDSCHVFSRTPLTAYNDNELVLRLQQGDVAAFDIIYKRYHESLYAFILRYLKSPQLAEDILQEVFMKLWEVRKQLRPGATFSAYLYKIARNKVFKTFRKIAADDEKILVLAGSLAATTEDPQAMALWVEYQRLFENAVERLPVQRKKVFRLCRQEGCTYDEVAAQLHISRNTVKEHMVLGTRFIREFIFQCYQVESVLLYLLLYTFF
ncbi:RNA polymerase sigma factor [Filimonas effusa]|uniref:RNA polymerase sigma factor n=1 Tax=Filimonas effusa TaxID=2508721 RepID=UPI0013E939A0|nr:RNA polymerase sigma-70 factor [Filimonas effusa]